MIKSTNRLILLMFFSILFIAILVGCSDSDSTSKQNSSGEDQQRLSFTTGGEGGVYYILGAAMTDIVNQNSDMVQLTAESSGGTVENLRLVGEDVTQFGLASPYMDVQAFKGKGENFDAPLEDLREALGGYIQPLYFVVRSDSNINSFKDFKDKKVAMPTAGFSTTMGKETLRQYGLDPDNDLTIVPLDFGEHVEALQNGQIDVSMQQSAPPNPSIQQMSETFDIRFVSYDDSEILDYLNNKFYGISFTIPGGTYEGIDEDATTFAVQSSLITNANVSDDVVYEVLDLLDEHRDKLSQAHPAGDGFSKENIGAALNDIPLHPGAEKWLKENEWIE